VALTPPPGEVTHWTGRAMAHAAKISLSATQRIWRAHGLQPHRLRQFKLSNDPQFAAKLRDIVGLYVDPPGHAVEGFFPPSSPNVVSNAASSTPWCHSKPRSTAS
jgi:hypothetical protein